MKFARRCGVRGLGRLIGVTLHSDELGDGAHGEFE